MTTGQAARIWHGGTALVAALALLLQLVLVVLGIPAPTAGDPTPGLAERLFHFVSYFTVLSNLLVLLTTAQAARRPATDGPVWRVLRLDAVVAITVTGLVHWFLLRPLIDSSGWPYLADKLLHVVVPGLALLGWLLFGPRPRIDLRTVLLGLVYPVAWLVHTLVVGAVSGWYPYPFLDLGERDGGAVALTCLGLAVLFFALSLLIWLGDRRFRRAPAPAPGRVPA